MEYLLLDRDIVAQSAEFTLEPDTSIVERTRLGRVERSPALRVGIVVIVLI